MSHVQFVDLPSSIIEYIVRFCNVQDMASFARACRITLLASRSSAANVLNEVVERHFPALRTKKERWLDGKSPFLKLYELINPQIIVIRGFITFSLDLRTTNWRRCHDSRRDRGYFVSVFYQGEIFAIGTFSLVAAGTVERYNPFTDYWTNVTPLPRKLRSVAAAVSHDNRLYIFGGIESYSEVVLDEIRVYDAGNDATNQFQEQQLRDLASAISTQPSQSSSASAAENSPRNKNSRPVPLPVWIDAGLRLLRPRYRHAAINYRSKMWIAGGCFENFTVTNTVEIIDLDQKRVITGPSMLVARDFANLVVLQDTLYAIGGDVDPATQHQTIRTIEKLVHDDAISATNAHWVHVTTFPNTRRGFSTAAYGTYIFVFGGSSSSSSEPTTSIDHNENNHELHTWDAFDVEYGRWVSDPMYAEIYDAALSRGEPKKKNSAAAAARFYCGGNDREMPLIDSWGQATTCPPVPITWS